MNPSWASRAISAPVCFPAAGCAIRARSLFSDPPFCFVCRRNRICFMLTPVTIFSGSAKNRNSAEVSCGKRRNPMRHRITVLASAGAVAAIVLAGCGSAGDRSTAIATAIGASSCQRTVYYIESKLDHSKTQIYDCARGGRELCVTEQDGIDRDQTALAKLLFAQNLSGGKPDCAK